MKLLALDPAAACGFCWSDGTRREWGSWQLTLALDKHPGARLERLRSHIYRVHRELGIEFIAFEEASLGAGGRKGEGGTQWSTIALHNKFRGVVELVAKELGVETLAVNPMSLKKFATGDGHAKKPQMMACLKLQFGIDVAGDDNASDAIWVGEFARQPRLPEPAKKKKRRLAKAAKKQPRLFA